jgi:vanadium-dependent haloperoxidase-like protein
MVCDNCLQVNIDHIPSNQPGKWRQDPISLHPLALGAEWGKVTPFVMRASDQFRVAAPPPINSQAYADAENTNDPVSLARLLALVNTAMTDAGIAIWESKYFYNYWRPVTGIREADPGTGPTGAGDDNPDTTGDVTFSPLGAPASNFTGPNFTPPFPAYPSGHAGFGGALFQTLRRFYGTDHIRFSCISDEFNGETVGNDGAVRPVVRRNYSRLSQAEEENGQSRIYLGIHWAFDKTQGIAQGRRVANYVFEHAFKRRHSHGQ